MKSLIEESAPGCIRSPFVIAIDKAEKAPWCFDGGIRARSFIDKDLRLYQPVRTERRYLGIGCGDYTIEPFDGSVPGFPRIAIERKSVADFQGTLLGWPVDAETANGREIDRRGRFKSELRKLQTFENRAVVVEAPLGVCLDSCPQWGTRTGEENAKYLLSTFLAWSQEFRVQWIFADDRESAAVIAFRLLEKFWSRHTKEYRTWLRGEARGQGRARGC